MASVLNMDGATIIGTVAQIQELLGLLAGAGVVNLDRVNLVIVGKTLTERNVKAAIEATPRKK